MALGGRGAWHWVAEVVALGSRGAWHWAAEVRGTEWQRCVAVGGRSAWAGRGEWHWVPWVRGSDTKHSQCRCREDVQIVLTLLSHNQMEMRYFRGFRVISKIKINIYIYILCIIHILICI